MVIFSSRIIIITFLFFLCFNTVVVHAQFQTQGSALPKTNVLNIHGKFLRVVETPTAIDTVNGLFYFMSPGKIFFEINYPVNQVMIIEGNIMIIYYPNTKKAFHIETSNPFVLPLITDLIAATRTDYGLTSLGFELYDYKVKEDTLFAFWSNPDVPEKVGQFKTAQISDSLLYTLYEFPNSNQYTKTSFADHISINNILFPTVILSEIFSSQGHSTEKVFLEGLNVNQGVPERVSNFKLPEDAIIKKTQW